MHWSAVFRSFRSGCGKQTAFLFKPALELRVRQCIEQTHHTNRDRGFLDQLDLIASAADWARFAVEADDEARGHKKDRMRRSCERSAQCCAACSVSCALRSASRCRGSRCRQRPRRNWRTASASRSSESSARFIEASVVNSEMGSRATSSHFAELRKERLDGFLVADEVCRPRRSRHGRGSRGDKLVELCEHLGGGLGARHPPIKLYDVAKLTGKWTAARELNADSGDGVELQESRSAGSVTWSRRFEKFFRLEKLPCAPAHFPDLDGNFASMTCSASPEIDAKNQPPDERWGHDVNSGAANDHRLPAQAWRESTTSSVSLCCGSMPPVKTRFDPIKIGVA